MLLNGFHIIYIYIRADERRKFTRITKGGKKGKKKAGETDGEDDSEYGTEQGNGEGVWLNCEKFSLGILAALFLRPSFPLAFTAPWNKVDRSAVVILI